MNTELYVKDETVASNSGSHEIRASGSTEDHIEFEEPHRQGSRAVYSTVSNGQKGVGLGCSEILLATRNTGDRWAFRLKSLHSDNEWLTAWIYLKEPEQLRTSPQAKIIRDTLKQQFQTEANSLLERAIGVLQDEPEEFHVKEEDQNDCLELGQNETELHPAGGMTSEFVYEPFGGFLYAYRTIEGKRGIASAQEERGDEERGIESRWYLTVEDERYYFQRKPENSWLFHTPAKDVVDSWVRGTRKSLSTQDLWNKTQVYYKTFLDLPHLSEHSILGLSCAQSWLTDLLHNVFYVGIQAEFGGGKTATGEALVAPCRHGFQTGNLSPAFVARQVDREKLTLFVDELDSVAGSKDSDLYQVFRQGTRRGGSYARINPETLQKEVYNVFGAKIYTMHGTVEAALQTRSVSIHLRETTNVEYPIIGAARVPFGHLLAEEWWLWYMDNAFELKSKIPEALSVAQVAAVAPSGKGEGCNCIDSNIDKTAEMVRSKIFEMYTPLLRNGQLGQLRQLTGRNVELGYLMFMISDLLGFDLDTDIMDALKQKISEEAEPREIGYMGVLREVLTAIWEEKRVDDDYLTDAGEVKISNKETYQRFNDALVKVGSRGVGSSTFRGYLTEFGFSDALNRKKMKILVPGKGKLETRLCNIFDIRVLKKLGIDPESGNRALLVEENLGLVVNYPWNRDEEGQLSTSHTGLVGHLKERGCADSQKLIQQLCSEEWRSNNGWWLEPHPTRLDTIRFVGRQ